MDQSLREQGKQALKDGNLDQAVDLLARAVMADDSDVEAKALLGVVYSQKGLHAQAKRALQTAVERDPQNVNYRFNLGIVCERAGDPQGAAIAFRDTLQLNPQHPQARTKLQAIPNAQQLLAQAPKATGPVGVPTYQPGDAPPGAPAGGAPPAGGTSYAPPAASPLAPPPPASAAPPTMTAPAGYGATMDAPPGTVQCPGCHQFSRIGLACEFCSSPLPVPEHKPSAPAFGPGSGQSSYGGPAPMARPGGYAALAPHRGSTVLTLGILALCCNILFIPGIMAIKQGTEDLQAMDSGYMDPSGRGITQAGKILGIVGTCFSALGLVARLALLLTGNG